ncbi:MAG: HPr family phosphocarrier protein [Devosiaceae bacterium]
MSDIACDPRTVLIRNQRGLHARASAKFVQLAESYDAEVSVTKGEQTVGGTSIMGLMMLAASPGCEIEVHATGEQARDALDALCKLVENRFGEEI